MPPAHGFVAVKIPSHILFQPVHLLLIDWLEKALLQRLVVLAEKHLVLLGHVEFQRLGEFPIQFRVVGCVEAETQFPRSEHPSKLQFRGLVNLLPEIVAHGLHEKQPVGRNASLDNAPLAHFGQRLFQDARPARGLESRRAAAEPTPENPVPAPPSSSVVVSFGRSSSSTLPKSSTLTAPASVRRNPSRPA